MDPNKCDPLDTHSLLSYQASTVGFAHEGVGGGR